MFFDFSGGGSEVLGDVGGFGFAGAVFFGVLWGSGWFV